MFSGLIFDRSLQIIPHIKAKKIILEVVGRYNWGLTGKPYWLNTGLSLVEMDEDGCGMDDDSCKMDEDGCEMEDGQSLG